jgi:hypothetical protein
MAPALVGWSSAYLLAGQNSPSMLSPDVLKAGGLARRSPPETAITGCAIVAWLWSGPPGVRPGGV